MINKVVVAAAGKGTRMLNHSQDKPKHLIEVNNRPFIFYLLDRLKTAGFKEIIMVIGYQKEIMKQELAKWQTDLKITIVNQQISNDKTVMDERQGTAVPMEICEQYLAKENFVALNGDSLWAVEDLKMMMIDDDLNYIAGLKSDTPEKYGVLVADENDFLKEIKEKPQDFTGDLINTGLYKFTPEIFEKIPLLEKSQRGEYELTDALNLLAAERKVKIKTLNHYWYDFGRPEDIPVISEFLKNNYR